MGMDPALKAKLQKQRYHIVGEHGGVKTCRWTEDRFCVIVPVTRERSTVLRATCMQMSPVVNQCNRMYLLLARTA